MDQAETVRWILRDRRDTSMRDVRLLCVTKSRSDLLLSFALDRSDQRDWFTYSQPNRTHSSDRHKFVETIILCFWPLSMH